MFECLTLLANQGITNLWWQTFWRMSLAISLEQNTITKNPSNHHHHPQSSPTFPNIPKNCHMSQTAWWFLLGRMTHSVYAGSQVVPCTGSKNLMSPSVGLSFICYFLSFITCHVPQQCWFVINFYPKKCNNMANNQFHNVEFGWSIHFCFHYIFSQGQPSFTFIFMFLILHRDGDKDVEWVHEKADWRRVGTKRDYKQKLLLYMT